jgi:DNA-binding NtrC family response regulator
LAIDNSISHENDWLRYGNRHSRLTKAILLSRQGHLGEAADTVAFAASLAARTGDQLLATGAELVRAEILLQMGRPDESLAALTRVVPTLYTQAPETFADYQRILARALLAGGNPRAANVHRRLAQRVFEGVRSVPGIVNLNRTWQQATAGAHVRDTGAVAVEAAPAWTGRDVLHDAAAVLLHAGRPELVATGVVSMLANTGSVVWATAVRRTGHGGTEILASTGTADTPPLEAARTLPIGSSQNHVCEVLYEPRPDMESAATLNSIALLLAAVRDLERAHADREERLTLWPLEDIAVDDDQAVVRGSMREVMSFARRVAATNVSVLITGESGTGKEILARAIHGYSPRSARPFVPFNCTAVPRELLESQLFGHRRGAFTGADRDQPGLIRAARDGTLFLDEIGELGLDLQPKLLRFLESGEISPLGEPGPLNVNVRIIAATNADLEQLVREGRFREDLFYRLNVVRLTIPPLRDRRDEIPALVHHFVNRAAAEFSKGRVSVAEETMEHLLLYPWPGNVRQLQNELRRMVALAEPDTVLEPAALSEPVRRAAPKAARPIGAGEIAVPLNDKLQPTISRIEREMIRMALRAHHGRVDAAAKALGISRKGLYLKRQRLGL